MMRSEPYTSSTFSLKEVHPSRRLGVSVNMWKRQLDYLQMLIFPKPYIIFMICFHHYILYISYIFINKRRPNCQYFETIFWIDTKLPISNYKNTLLNQINCLQLFTKIAYTSNTKIFTYSTQFSSHLSMPPYHPCSVHAMDFIVY